MMPPRALLPGPGIVGSEARKVLSGELRSLRVQASTKPQECPVGLIPRIRRNPGCGVRMEDLFQCAVTELCWEAESRKFSELFENLSQIVASRPDDTRVRVITYEVFETWARCFNIMGVDSFLRLFRRLNETSIEAIHLIHFLSVLLGSHPKTSQVFFRDPQLPVSLSVVDALPAGTRLRIHLLFVSYLSEDGCNVNLNKLVLDVLLKIGSDPSVLDKLQPEELRLGHVFTNVATSCLRLFPGCRARERLVPKEKNESSSSVFESVKSLAYKLVPQTISNVASLGQSNSNKLESRVRSDGTLGSKEGFALNSLVNGAVKETTRNRLANTSCGEGTLSLFDASCMRSTSASTREDEEMELRIDKPEFQGARTEQRSTTCNRDTEVLHSTREKPETLDWGDNYGSVTTQYFGVAGQNDSITTRRSGAEEAVVVREGEPGHRLPSVSDHNRQSGVDAVYSKDPDNGFMNHQGTSGGGEVKTTNRKSSLLHLQSTTTSSSIELDENESLQEKSCTGGYSVASAPPPMLQQPLTLHALTRPGRVNVLLANNFIPTLVFQLKRVYINGKSASTALRNGSSRPIVDFESFVRMIQNGDLPGTSLLMRMPASCYLSSSLAAARIKLARNPTSAMQSTTLRSNPDFKNQPNANPTYSSKNARQEGSLYEAAPRFDVASAKAPHRLVSKKYMCSAPAQPLVNASDSRATSGAGDDSNTSEPSKSRVCRRDEFHMGANADPKHYCVQTSASQSNCSRAGGAIVTQSTAVGPQSGSIHCVGDHEISVECTESPTSTLNLAKGNETHWATEALPARLCGVDHTTTVEVLGRDRPYSTCKELTVAETTIAHGVQEVATVGEAALDTVDASEYSRIPRERVLQSKANVHVCIPSKAIFGVTSPSGSITSQKAEVLEAEQPWLSPEAGNILLSAPQKYGRPEPEASVALPGSLQPSLESTSSDGNSVPMKATSDFRISPSELGIDIAGENNLVSSCSKSSGARRDPRVPQLSLSPVVKFAMGTIECFPGDSAIRGLIADGRHVPSRNTTGNDFANCLSSSQRLLAVAHSQLTSSLSATVASEVRPNDNEWSNSTEMNEGSSKYADRMDSEESSVGGFVNDSSSPIRCNNTWALTGRSLVGSCISNATNELLCSSDSPDSGNRKNGVAGRTLYDIHRRHLQSSEPARLSLSSLSLAEPEVQFKVGGEQFGFATKADYRVDNRCRSLALEVVEAIANRFDSLDGGFGSNLSSQGPLTAQIVSELCNVTVRLLQAEPLGVDLVGPTLVVSDTTRMSLFRGMKAWRSYDWDGDDITKLDHFALSQVMIPTANIAELLGLESATEEERWSANLETTNVLILGNFACAGEAHKQDYPWLLFYIMALKIVFPRRLFLLRGAFEDFLMSALLGEERRFVEQFGENGANLWRRTFDVLEFLPLYARISHGDDRRQKLGLRYACVPGDAPIFTDSGTESILEVALKGNFAVKQPVTSFLNRNLFLEARSFENPRYRSNAEACNGAPEMTLFGESKSNATAQYLLLRGCLFAMSFGPDDWTVVQDKLQEEAPNWPKTLFNDEKMLAHRQKLMACLDCNALVRPTRNHTAGSKALTKRLTIFVSSKENLTVEELGPSLSCPGSVTVHTPHIRGGVAVLPDDRLLLAAKTY